jgi:hypothetical protein
VCNGGRHTSSLVLRAVLDWHNAPDMVELCHSVGWDGTAQNGRHDGPRVGSLEQVEMTVANS